MSEQQKATYKKVIQDYITNFTANFIGIGMFVVASVPSLKMNSIPSTMIDTYPNYLWAYSYHLIIHVCFQFLANVVMLIKNPEIKIMVTRELKERMNNLSW
jgi:hypothetical protein